MSMEIYLKQAESFRKTKTDLIHKHLFLAVSMAKSYIYTGVPIEDLIQLANMGLMIACGKYDNSKNVDFSAFARWYIRREIVNGISKNKIDAELEEEQIADTYEEVSTTLPKCYNDALRGLDEDEQYVLDRKIGLTHNRKLTFIEISRNLGVHKNTSANIYKRAINKLKGKLNGLRERG